MQSKSHWETVYSSQSADAVSWYQPHAQQSLRLIERIAAGRLSRVIDIGGGASTLVDDLLAQPWADVLARQVRCDRGLSRGLAGGPGKRCTVMGVSMFKAHASKALEYEQVFD